jgi:hypothetical protein
LVVLVAGYLPGDRQSDLKAKGGGKLEPDMVVEDLELK